MDMNNIIKQAQEFQQKMSHAQEDLAKKTLTATAGGGMVSVTINGGYELLAVSIDKEVIDPDDPVMLQDLILAAVNDAVRKVREMTQSEMSALTGGLRVPGLFG